jgi:RHS repeat-associated protein
LNHDGEVVARSAHEPYGEPFIEWTKDGHDAPEYRFTDKEDDHVSGAVYIGARHYLPALGRWASVDPLVFKPDGLGGGEADGFGYVAGNPVNGIDPNGLETVGEWLKGRAESAGHDVQRVLGDGQAAEVAAKAVSLKRQAVRLAWTTRSTAARTWKPATT